MKFESRDNPCILQMSYHKISCKDYIFLHLCPKKSLHEDIKKIYVLIAEQHKILSSNS